MRYISFFFLLNSTYRRWTQNYAYTQTTHDMLPCLRHALAFILLSSPSLLISHDGLSHNMNSCIKMSVLYHMGTSHFRTPSHMSSYHHHQLTCSSLLAHRHRLFEVVIRLTHQVSHVIRMENFPPAITWVPATFARFSSCLITTIINSLAESCSSSKLLIQVAR
jgi:hypothetical protein